MHIMLQHVSIPRPPGEESASIAKAFYSELVGLTIKPTPSTIAHLDLVWFKIGEETELHVFSETDNSKDPSLRHFCLQIQDSEAMRQKLIDNGYNPWFPEEIQGRPRFFCRDPFENIVEFTQIDDDYLKYQQTD